MTRTRPGLCYLPAVLLLAMLGFVRGGATMPPRRPPGDSAGATVRLAALGVQAGRDDASKLLNISASPQLRHGDAGGAGVISRDRPMRGRDSSIAAHCPKRLPAMPAPLMGWPL